MRTATLDPHEQVVLRRLCDYGAVLDFVLLDLDRPDERSDSEVTHRDAVIAAMRALQAISSFVTIDEEKSTSLAGVRVSHPEFLGTNYDFARDRILLGYAYPSTVLPDGRIESEPPDPCALWGRPPAAGVGAGYAYAFSETPHGLRLKTPEQVAMFFSEVNSILLRGIHPDSIIFEWPTDWSTYFDAGHEWWGSFLWSFGNPGAPRIAVIAASTTD